MAVAVAVAVVVVVVGVVGAPKAVPKAGALMAAVRRVRVRSVISLAHAVEAAAAEFSCAVRSLSARHDFPSYP